MSTVLVVDDHKPTRQLIAALLEPRGHYVIQANDGEEALAHIDECVPALVISDILMPRMDGYEFVRRLRSDTRTANVEVLFYTAYYREHEARRLALDLGVVGLLHKPCDPEHLLRTIDLALAANSRPSVATDQERVDREHLRLLTDKLSEQAERLQRANARLSALTELNLQIASERDSTVLLDKVCRGARELLGARYAVIAAREMPEGENVDLYVDGFDDALTRRLSPASAAFSQLGGMTSDRKSLRLNGQECESGTLGLPNEHPKVRSLLAAPIVSLGATYGWICATDKVDADRFDAEDERLLTILGAQLGRAHENGRLYRELERHAVQLRAEIVERERNEKRIERLNSVLAVLGGINALAARVRTRAELFREVCRVAVEQGKFKLAWIGSPDEDNAVHAMSWAGKTSEIARVMHIPLNDPIARESVVGRAFVERRIAFCKDVSDPSAPVLYRDTLLSHGLRSVAVLPLVVDDETQACLVLYGDAVGQFDETERPLLSELADDLSFALRHVRAEERLDYIAYFDELTGLANRTLFIERATQTVKAAVLTDIRLAVLLVDIDRFKTVNDTFGRRWGDRLLNEFANRLASAVGDTRL
ncbi:MAG TPA: GAF domain-containing protein, partial [Burkholderiaceae bacterium]|nr:GAF domain-containing protein [Burkholderiaceae bacterium]